MIEQATTAAVAAKAQPTHQPAVATERGLRLLGGGSDPLGGAPVSAVHSVGAELWALVADRDLYRVAGDATELVAQLPDGATGTCVGTHRGVVWVGGDDAGLWRLVDGRLAASASFRRAPGRADWHTPWGGPPSVFSMASDGTALYVSVHVGGIMRTTDGESWIPTIDLHDDVHQVALGPDGTVWAATGRRGLASSTDGGATWSYHSAGLHARYLLAVAPVAGGVLVGASSGHAGRDGAVYRFDGESFARSRGLPDDLRGAVGPRRLAGMGEHAVVALPGGDVYASHDGGDEWSRLARGVGHVAEITLHELSATVSGDGARPRA